MTPSSIRGWRAVGVFIDYLARMVPAIDFAVTRRLKSVFRVIRLLSTGEERHEGASSGSCRDQCHSDPGRPRDPVPGLRAALHGGKRGFGDSRGRRAVAVAQA